MTHPTARITSASDVLRRYAAGERSFPFADLRDAHLTRADLAGANLRDAHLTRADLAVANLRDANLTRADLAGADLAGANLRDADLAVANLYGADLRVANLAGADLRVANLTRANLRGANLYGANLRGANLTRANLYGANLRDADLAVANLYGANLRVANLAVADLPSNSHDLIAEVLRQATTAGDVQALSATGLLRLGVAGTVLLQRDWCWREFAVAIRRYWGRELAAWIVATLAPWPALREQLEAHGIVEFAAGGASEGDNDE